jgi:hypothetical protein
LAATGKGEDSRLLDDPQRVQLRKQAFQWLQSECSLGTERLQDGKPVDFLAAQLTLRRCLNHPDLVEVRDPSALARLPETERVAWQELWRAVRSALTEREVRPGTRRSSPSPSR